MCVDPLAQDYAYNSPYAFQENKMGMGRELEGLELAPFVRVAFATSDAVKLSTEVATKVSESATRAAEPKTEVHHVIPRAAKGNEAVKNARDDGFKFEGAENKMPIEKFSKASGKGQHGNHPNYNKGVADKLAEFSKTTDGKSALEFVRTLVNELKETINNNPDVKINDVLKTVQPVQDNTNIPKPELPKEGLPNAPKKFQPKFTPLMTDII